MDLPKKSFFQPHWLLPAGFTLLLLFLSWLPYTLAQNMARPGTIFTGTLMNPEDSQSYFAKMSQGYDGHWLYTIPFTPETHEPAFVGGFYLLLGHLARWLHLSPLAMWDVARLAAIPLLVGAIYWFIGRVVSGREQQTVTFILALTGSGLGWLLFLFGQSYWLDTFPVDFKMAEAHLFFTTLTFPHVIIGTALLTLSLGHFLQTSPSPAGFITHSLLNLAIAIVYPFLIYLVMVVAALLFLRHLKWATLLPQATRLAIPFLLPLPLLAYYAWVLGHNPVFAAWDAQAATLSPPWPHYLVAYGPMLLLAFLFLAGRPQPAGYDLLWLWLLAVGLLVYAPLNPQRRFVQGLQLPLSILAVASLYHLLLPRLAQTAPFRWLAARPGYSPAGLQRFLLFQFLLVMALSNLYVITSLLITATTQQPDLLFRPEAEQIATDWLRQSTGRDQTILADYQSGNYIAAQAGNPVFIGHWAETMAFSQKQQEISQFFSNEVDNNWRLTFFHRYNISYLWYGPREQQLGPFNPQQLPNLTPVFSHPPITIYAIREP